MEPGQQQQKGGNKSVFPFFLSRLGNRILQCRKELCATADGKREKLPVRCFGAAAAVATWWGQWRRGAEIWSGCVSDNGSQSAEERSDAVVQTANAILDEMTQPKASSEKEKKKKRESYYYSSPKRMF